MIKQDEVFPLQFYILFKSVREIFDFSPDTKEKNQTVRQNISQYNMQIIMVKTS